MPFIRVKSVCVVRHDGRLLLAEGYDPGKDQHYLIPIGGGVEFGEASAETAQREMLEEIGVELATPTLLGVSENRFEYEGVPGHEIVFVYEAALVDESLYEQAEFAGVETSGGTFRALWVPEAEALSGARPLYPDGLTAMLSA